MPPIPNFQSPTIMNQIFALTIKDLKILARDRGGLVALFAMPIMFIVVMSVALQGLFDVGSAENPVALLVVNLDAGATAPNGDEIHLGEDMVAALSQFEGLMPITRTNGQPLSRAQAEEKIVNNGYRIAMVIPADFSQRVMDAIHDPQVSLPDVVFIVDPTASTQLTAPVKAAVLATANRTVAYAQAPYQIRVALEAAAAGLPADQQPVAMAVSSALTDELAQTYGPENTGGQSEVQISETTPASYRIDEVPTSVEQSVPGYAVFGVFFVVGVLASSILSEKETGTFRRLLAAPLSNAALLLGKLLPYYLVNIVQVTLMFAIGVLAFGMSLGNSFAALAAVTLATAAAATGLGLLVASLGKTERQISGISTLLSLTLAAIGGVMVPVFVMPDFMQTLAKISPHYWAMQGYQDVIVRGLGVQSVAQETAVLLGFAAVFYAFAVWKFKFE